MELEYRIYTQDDYIYKYMCTVGGGWWMVTEKTLRIHHQHVGNIGFFR